MKKIVFFTAIYGNYDTPKAILPIRNVDYVLFTADETTADIGSRKGWIVKICKQENIGNHLIKAKKVKIKFWKFLSKQYEKALWIDGSIIIKSSRIIAYYLIDGNYPITCTTHPDRDCIYQEAEICLSIQRHKNLPIKQQVDIYRKKCYPENNGLLASGVIEYDLKKLNILKPVLKKWWREILTKTYRDQIGLPYILWKQNTWCNEVKINLWNNTLFEVLRHNETR